jgi:hypothetical protein
MVLVTHIDELTSFIFKGGHRPPTFDMASKRSFFDMEIDSEHPISTPEKKGKSKPTTPRRVYEKWSDHNIRRICDLKEQGKSWT